MKRASDYDLHLAGLGEAYGYQNDMGDPLSHTTWTRKLEELRRIARDGLGAAHWAVGWVTYPAGTKKLGHERADMYREVLERAASKLEEFAAVMKEFDDLPE